MVFESLVADLLNRFLGDFVDNLDSSQLNIGIWGGDVKLENLEVKESALDDFDLPIKLKFGYLESLILKIPWKNLYTEPVIATIDGLYLIAVPNKGVVYNEEKAKKTAADIKQKTLARLEEARKNRRKPTDPHSDTFAEKMVTQIIKNLQISISNIHVRYEDKYTNRHRPFVAGVTLESLDFRTTDDNWIPTIHKEAVKIIHKLVSLDNLALYWNSKAELISDQTDKALIKKKLKDTICCGKQKPDGYRYILEPIKMQAKLKLNQKPETDGTDWTTPKIDLAVDMQAIALAIGKLQYQDVLLFLEAQERFTMAGHYLKYRPHLNEYKGHYRDWWKFAYACIMEEKVRRRRNNWSWQRMKQHRKLVREYRDAWVLHQTQKSPPHHVTETVKKAESTLDVFNVNVARQQAEMEIDRQGLTRLEDQPQGWIAWGKSWFGGGGGAKGEAHKEPVKKGGKDIASQFQEAMTSEEKSKLFEAIDYQENIPPTNYPKEFVENKFAFKLNEVAVKIDGAIALQFLQLKAHVEQRPSAGAMNVVSSIQELRMDGCGVEMLRVRDPSRAWLSLLLDTRPLSGEYDQKVKLSIAPVNIKYHAPAVNNAIDVFKPPDSVRLNQLTALAMSRYEEVKTRSVTGLAHAVENKSKLVLDIHIEPAALMVSEGGIYKADMPTIIADLGLLTVKTVHDFGGKDVAHKTKMESLTEQAYDKFRVQLSNVVVLMAENYQKAHDALSHKESPLHILKPTGLDIQIHKSAIDDLQLPKIKIVGDLPDIVVGISDTRLLMMMKLLNSIPKPEIEPEPVIEEESPVEPVGKLKDRAKMRTIMETDEIDDVIEKNQAPVQEEDIGVSNEQQVQVELDLRLNRIGLVLSRKDVILCDVSINRMTCKLQMRTFDMVITAELGAVRIALPTFSSLDPQRPHLYLIDNNEKEGVLMRLKFVQANPESPFFDTEYRRTEQTVDFQFSKLNVCLHQEGLLELKQFGEKLQAEMDKLEAPKPTSRVEDTMEQRTRKISRAISSSVESLTALARSSQSEAAIEKRKARKERAMVEADPTVIKMRIEAKIGSLALLMGTERNGLETKFAIQKVTAYVGMTIKATDVTASLEAITIEDCTKNALYKKLMSVSGDREMLKFEMTQYQRTEAEKQAMQPADVDMKVQVRLAQMRFVFLNLWLVRLMNWLSPFQEEAQKAAAAAQQAASEKAKEAAENVKQILEVSPPRIELDVELEAPMIVVPRLSSSPDVIVALLGNVSVKNKITGHRDHKKAVLDRMEIQLTEMALSIGSMTEDNSKTVSTCPILNPLTFTINCHRNLTFATVKNIPEITVNAKIPAIEMNMSEQDYTTIMQTLSGNLAEGKDETVPQPVQAAPVESSPPSSVSTEEDDEEKEAREKKKSTAVPKKSTVTPSDRIATTGPPASSFNRIVFQFSLDKIVAILYTGGTQHGTIRRAQDAFAAMRLNDLKLSGLIKEDNALDVSMSLSTFTMKDERKALTKINHLMDKKPDHENEQFLSLRFSQNNDNDRNVACTMAAFYICLCPEFLGCLTRFFSVPVSEEQQEQQAVTAKGNSTTGSKTTAPVQTAPAGSLTIDCTMNGIEVILVENSMEPDTTQALILSFNINLDAKPSDKVTTMKGGVEKLAVFSSYYAPSRRNEVTYEVLKPIDIGVEVIMDAKTKACEAVLKMSPMEVKMSPSVIRLLSNVNAEFAKSSQVDTTAPSSPPKQRCYPNYWNKSRIDKKSYWFLNAPTAEEATEGLGEEVDENVPSKPPQETAKILIERISFTLEAGNALIPVPMIFLDLLVNAEASNWSSALKASADVSIQMSYYNEAFSVWEPVIEQVEVASERFERWTLRAHVKGRNKLDSTDTSPALDVKIEADKILNVTVTKSFLSLLNQLSEVFAQAAKQISPPSSRALPGTSQFVLRNETGLPVKILDSESISVFGQSNEATHGSYVNLDMKQQGANRTLTAQNCLAINHEELQALLRLDIVDNVRELKIGRAERRSIPLGKRSEAGKQWKVIAKTTIENSRRLVTLSSHIRVKNHLDVTMELYAKKDNSTLDLFGAVQPGEILALPVPLLYTATGEIFFKPANDRCEVSFESLSWHNFEENPCKRQIIRCDLSSDLSQSYFFETVLKTKEVEESADKAGFQHTIHLYLPLQFHNNLPIPVTIEQPIGQDLQPGESIQLNAISGSRLKLWASYLGEMYNLDMKIPTEKKDVDVVALNTETGSKEFLLGLNWSHEHGDQKVYLFAPFWLVNNTSLPLRHAESTGFLSSARGCVSCHKKSRADMEDELDTTLMHPPDDNPLILPFPSADLSKKKKGKVQIENVSGWSDEIPLDVVGNPSRIVCKAADRDYEMTVDIKLCQSGLTKVVTFTPFYLVSNLSRFDMEVKEDQQKNWIAVPAEKCVGVWPVSRSKKKLYSARYADSHDESLLFPIAENLETMCEIAGDVAGVNVSVSTSESSVAIHLSPFVGGCAPVCVMNTLKTPVIFGQKGHKRMKLGRNEMAYFTWASITENRVMEIECGDWKYEDKLEMNQLRDVFYDKDSSRCAYATSFLLGRQRTFLFTDDLDIAHSAHGSWEQDTVDMQAEVNLQGIGLSVVDNLAGKEILYVGISSSDILWEEESKPNSGRFKPLAVKVMEELEEKYQQHLVQPNNDYQSLDQFEVNMAFMILKKKKGKEFKIRRTFERGIWMNYGQSYQRKNLHFKLNHLQIDNQLDACIFPRVLAIVPPPKSVVQDNAPKPFIELSVLQRVSEFSTVPEIEYAKVLVQEFAIQVDVGLLNSLMALVASQRQSKPYGKETFDQDYEMANVKLEDTANLYKAMRPKSFYKCLHISPLMIHLSFSQGGATDQNIIQSEFINLFMKSVGVSMTELQDVVFKLAYFERVCVFYSQDQLNSETVNHYAKQFMKQLYVLVFGLDIIGNPFGLVRDLSAGVEDLFYQPFQGLVQGPEEFIQGVGIGVQSMLGHTLGGAAGAVGRITGTVGKGVAALTFDQEYQKKRQEDINRRPQNVGEGMARSFKGLGMGLMDGVTGLVTKPAEGLRKEGAAGLFKGVGKGLIGVVARPVSGVVDFASGTMSTIRTVAGTNTDAAALRPPRVIREDKIIRPFSSVEAVGYKIYKDTDRGALAETNQFVTYAPITDRMALLVTNKQLVLVKRTDIMGIWTVDWQTEYGKIHEPTFVDGGIKILLKEKKKGFLGIGASEGKIITFPNSEMIQQKVLAAYRAATSE